MMSKNFFFINNKCKSVKLNNNYNDTVLFVKDFICGKTDIYTFMEAYQESTEIKDLLQNIVNQIIQKNIPIKRRTYIDKKTNRTYQPKPILEELIPKSVNKHHLFRKSKSQSTYDISEYIRLNEHKSISGAYRIFLFVSDIYFQIDSNTESTDYYKNEYEFMLDVIPRYLCSGTSEEYISSQIIPKYPADMKKALRKNTIKEEIKNTFKRECKAYPRWLQNAQWPIGTDNLPMLFIKQEITADTGKYYFKDSTTGEIQIVTQTC